MSTHPSQPLLSVLYVGELTPYRQRPLSRSRSPRAHRKNPPSACGTPRVRPTTVALIGASRARAKCRATPPGGGELQNATEHAVPLD
jgi:hypothetical protein